MRRNVVVIREIPLQPLVIPSRWQLLIAWLANLAGLRVHF